MSEAADQGRSGQTRLRMPISLHEAIVRSAAAEGVSLNQFICSALAASVGWRPAQAQNAGGPKEVGGPGDVVERPVSRPQSPTSDEEYYRIWRNILR
jgi:hypothetical protein